MLRKLRVKFVAVSMALVTVFLLVLVYTVYRSARENLEHVSTSVLHRVIEEQPGQYGGSLGGRKTALPYFTVDFWSINNYSVTGGTYSEADNREALRMILTDCLAREEKEGTLYAYGLRYLRRETGWYIRIAFVDISAELTALRRLFGSCLLIALTALLPLIGISILLSRWAVAPVEAAWRQQRQFLSDASHELKTPLTVILSNADLLLSARLDAKSRRRADNIRSESRRMKALVEEMLTLARADDGIKTAVFGAVNLSDAAAESALSFEPVAFEAGKPLQYDIAPDVTVTGDGEKLRRLIAVLLDNAVKYGADGGAITLSLTRTDRQARLIVSNPGEPIPPEHLSRLFERFYRADRSRGEQSGFGLGLSIAQSIAQEHRGTLKAESDGQSTRFLYTMPLRKRTKEGGKPS